MQQRSKKWYAGSEILVEHKWCYRTADRREYPHCTTEETLHRQLRELSKDKLTGVDKEWF